MKVLVFGAGPLGSLYAHLLHRSGADVTLLARGDRLESLRADGLVLVNEITGERFSSRPALVDGLATGDAYDLVIVLVRKNRLGPVFDQLSACAGIDNILFMGNNVSGFGEYLAALPPDKLLFGFPGAGGGLREQVVHFADREKPRGRRRAVTIGEVDGRIRERTMEVCALFADAGVPVTTTDDIDGWLKYHAALVVPLAGAIYMHGLDCRRAAADRPTLRALVRAAKEGGVALREMGYRKRQPFDFNLFYWLPEWTSMRAVSALLNSRFAEVAFAMHAGAALDEMQEITVGYRDLVAQASVSTPNIDALGRHIVSRNLG